MQNNKILKSIRYALRLRDKKMVKIFKLGGIEVTEDEASEFLRKEDEDMKPCNNRYFHSFLNGLIKYYRTDLEDNGYANKFIRITKANANNIVLKKLKLAFGLKSDDLLQIFKLGDLELSKSELSAVLRSEDSKNYRECGDKYMRRFLKGFSIYKRGKETDTTGEVK